MGKGQNKKGKKLKKFSGEAGTGEVDSQCSVDKLLDKCDGFMNTFEFDRAKTCCQRALHLEPNNVRAIETLATIALETNDVEEAKQYLSMAVQVNPAAGYSKYMSLGQLVEGQDALRSYQKGIELMQQELNKLSQNTDFDGALSGSKKATMTRDLSTAYCSIAELYLTDCCFDDDAEQRCADSIETALQVDPTNPEAHQYKASFLLTKNEMQEAKSSMLKSLSLWLPRLQNQDKENSEETPVQICPLSYEARISAAKILIELEDYDYAVDVLEGLIEEIDDDVEVWYLMGWSNYLKGEDYKTNARYYFRHTKELSVKTNFQDGGIIEHTDELLAELGPDDFENEELNGAEEPEDPESSSEEEEEEVKQNGVAGSSEDAMEH